MSPSHRNLPDRSVSTDAVVVFSGGSVALIGALGLAGWLWDMRRLTAWQSGTVPIAPLTSLLAILLGAALVLASYRHRRPTMMPVVIGLANLGAVMAFGVGLVRMGGWEPRAELLGLTITGSVGDAPIGFVSPITAFSLFMVNLALLAVLDSVSWLAAAGRGAGVALLLFGFVLVVTNLLGAPLLSGIATIPVSLAASTVILIGGLAIWQVETQPDDMQPAPARRYVWVFLGIGLSILLVGYAYYRQLERDLRGEAVRQLQSISGGVASSVTRWRQERMSDAAVIRQSFVDAATIGRALRDPVGARAWLQKLFNVLQDGRQYDRLLLVDPSGTLIASESGSELPSPASLRQGIQDAMRVRAPVLQDFYVDQQDQRAYLALVIPMFAELDATAVGALVLRVDPERTLQPALSAWLTRSPSMEAVMVRRDRDAAQYLTRSGLSPGEAMRAREPLTRAEVGAVQAVLGTGGVIEAMDDRGSQTLAFATAVADSPWWLVVQMDAAEFRLRLWRQVRVVTSVVVLLLFSSGAGLAMLWRQRRMAFFQERAAMATTLQHAEEQLRELLVNSPTIIYALDDRGAGLVPRDVSDNIFRILGFTPEEALTPDWWFRHLHPADRELAVAEMARMESADEFVHEYRFLRRDGRAIWIHDHLRVVRRENGRAVAIAGAWHDVTERRNAESLLGQSDERLRAALQAATRLAQLYAALSKCNDAIVRSTSETELLQRVCEAAVTQGGMAMAWVGLVDEPTGRVVPMAAFGAGTEYLDGIAITVCGDLSVDRGPTGTCIREDRAVWLEDLQGDAPTAPWLERAHRFGWSSSAGLPLIRDGRAIGALTIYAADEQAFDDEGRRLLVEMATNISFALDTLDGDARRVAAEGAVEASLREKEALLRELHHRVKNNLQVITSLLRLEAGRATRPDVRRVLGEMQTRVLSMALLHETLYRAGNLVRVDLAHYLPRLTQQIFGAHSPSPAITLHLDIASIDLELDQAVPCGLIVNELVSNTLKHAFPDAGAGDVRVSAQRVDGGSAIQLTVADTGVGLPADFREARQRSLGLQLVDDLTRELNGSIRATDGPGATFTLTFAPRRTP